MAESRTNITIEELNRAISSYIDIKNGFHVRFPGTKDKVTNAMDKINRIVPMFNLITPDFWDVHILGLNYGVTDEEARRDIPERLSFDQYMELSKKGEPIDATWRPACYSVHNPTKICYMISMDDKEFNNVTRNGEEYRKLLALKMSDAYRNETLDMNNITHSIFKNFLKSILKIYKNAPKFEAAKAYKFDGSDRIDTNVGLYDVHLTYLKNADGTKLGIVFNDITVEDNIQTFEEAVEKKKIRIVNFIKKINRPHKSEKDNDIEKNAENQAIATNFLYQIRRFDTLNARKDSDNDHGRTLNGSETSTFEYLNSSVRILTDVLDSVILDHSENTMHNQFPVDLLNRAITTEEFFTSEEIAADENGDKLGIGKIWGFIYDQSGTNGEFGLLNVYITQNESKVITNNYPVDYNHVKGYTPLVRYYFYNVKRIMEKISYNKYFCILMEN